MDSVQQYIVYSKSGAQCFNWNSATLKKEPVKHLQLTGAPVTKAGYSPDGKWVVAAKESEVVLATTSDSSPHVHVLPRKGVTRLSFSPRGTYLVTWESPVPAEPKNLFIWKLSSDGAQESPVPVFSMLRKSVDTWPLFVWSPDETLCARFTNEGITVCNGAFESTEQQPAAAVSRIKANNARRVAWSPNSAYLGVFTLPKAGMPGSVAVYNPRVKDGRPLSTRAFFRGDECQMVWNPDTSADSTSFLLALVNTDMDATGKSYYGESALYAVYPTTPIRNAQITFKKEGNIHAIGWNPTGKYFAVVYGCIKQTQREREKK